MSRPQGRFRAVLDIAEALGKFVAVGPSAGRRFAVAPSAVGPLVGKYSCAGFGGLMLPGGFAGAFLVARFLAFAQNLARVNSFVGLRQRHEVHGPHFERFGHLDQQAEPNVAFAVFYPVEGRAAYAQHVAEANLADPRVFAQTLHVESDDVALFGSEYLRR